jgi:serine/threonine-protein kinase
LLAVVAIGWIFFFSGQDVAVPDLVGLQPEQAEVVLTEAGLELGNVTEEPTLDVEPGIILSQSPAAAEEAPEGSAVDIAVSAIPKAEVPDVVDKPQSEAIALLAEAGLLTGDIDYEESDKVKTGYVISQDPESGTEVTVGARVALTTSLGEAEAEEPAKEDEPAAEEPADEEEPAKEESTSKVPNVVGLSEADAESTLKGADLKSDSKKVTSKDVAAGDVVSQSPKAGTVMATGSTVEITVSKGAPDDPKATVPNVVGMGVLESIGALVNANLKFAIEFAAATENYFKVAAQDPAAGAEVDPGTKVTLSVGLPDIASILEGLTSGAAEQPVTLPAQPDAEQPAAPESEVTTP